MIYNLLIKISRRDFMVEILKKQVLNPFVSLISLNAPFIAKKALPGQFVIIKVDEKGERIPLTIFKSDNSTCCMVNNYVFLENKNRGYIMQ